VNFESLLPPGAQNIKCRNPTYTDWFDEMSLILKEAKENPDENYLVMQFFAGHGMSYNGMQVVLTNEYDEVNHWYKMLSVETYIRIKSKDYPNVFFLSFFACCREIYQRDGLDHAGISRQMMEEAKAKALPN
jgi:hypothetical protein